MCNYYPTTDASRGPLSTQQHKAPLDQPDSRQCRQIMGMLCGYWCIMNGRGGSGTTNTTYPALFPSPRCLLSGQQVVSEGVQLVGTGDAKQPVRDKRRRTRRLDTAGSVEQRNRDGAMEQRVPTPALQSEGGRGGTMSRTLRELRANGAQRLLRVP
ncbi:unnamed protein product [Lota lota]